MYILINRDLSILLSVCLYNEKKINTPLINQRAFEYTINYL